MLGSLILDLKGMRITMFQLSGYYCRTTLYMPRSSLISHRDYVGCRVRFSIFVGCSGLLRKLLLLGNRDPAPQTEALEPCFAQLYGLAHTQRI